MAAEKKPKIKDKAIEEGKIFAVIAYLLFLCIVTLVLKKENKFALFHGKQGLVILIFWVAAAIFRAIPILGGLIWLAAVVILGVASVAGVFQSVMGNFWKIPVIGDMADRIKI